MVKGIDVSRFQGVIDFNKVAASGVDFVIVKAGEKYSKNEMLEINYAGAKSAGLHVGAYWYSHAMSVADAKNEAASCIAALAGKQLDYPVYFDLEEKKQFDKGREFCSEIVTAFCDALEAAGYFAGLYISRSPLQTHITDEVAKRYALWIAEAGPKCKYNGSYGIWQYAIGTCPGISGNVDLDFGYVDYPSIIVGGGFNGYGSAAPTIPEVRVLKTGDKLSLENTPLYASAYAARQSNVISGDYYVQSDDIICDRIRITTSAGNPVVTGWVNVDDIKTSDVSDNADVSELSELKVGYTVRLRDGAKDYNGGGLAPFVYQRDHTVTEISDDRAVIAYNGAVVAAVHTADLALVV